MTNNYILTLACPDQIGIVAKVSQFIADHNGWITEASQHGEPASNFFFMRVSIRGDSLPFDVEEMRKQFAPIGEKFKMHWQVWDTAINKKVGILVSKYDHCLSDILYRWRAKEFDFDIPCVISNHDDLRPLVEWHNIPYHHVPIDNDNKTAGFDETQRLLAQYDVDCLVLARYMQILPKAFCEQHPGNIINIHHSFLPSFVGAKPYDKAFGRGVKLIGATCHYVTETLDAGPIIEQDVIRVNHSHTVGDMVRLGKDVEKNVLARGLRSHIQNRVLLHENKTIVFD